MDYAWPVLGNAHALEELEQDIRENRLSHAYLFEGPYQLGKTLVTRTFAQILQCPNGFCRTCTLCQQIERGQHIDTLELLDSGESLKVETIKELLSHLSTTHSGRYKIIFLQNLERIVEEAANMLLKAIEEPISGVIFLITATQSQQLLPTLISRVRTIPFRPVPDSLIRDALKERRPDLDDVSLTLMTTFAVGRPGRAFEFLDDPERFRFHQDISQNLTRLLQRSTLTERMTYVNTLVEDPRAIESFFERFTHIVRGLIFAGPSSSPYSLAQLFAILDALGAARFQLEHNVNPKLALENLMINMDS